MNWEIDFGTFSQLQLGQGELEVQVGEEPDVFLTVDTRGAGAHLWRRDSTATVWARCDDPTDAPTLARALADLGVYVSPDVGLRAVQSAYLRHRRTLGPIPRVDIPLLCLEAGRRLVGRGDTLAACIQSFNGVPPAGLLGDEDETDRLALLHISYWAVQGVALVRYAGEWFAFSA